MELRQHIGVLVLLIMFMYLWYAWNDRIRKRYKLYIPLAGSIMVWMIFECFYWVVVLLIL